MIYSHEAALLRIADLRHQAAAERRARKYQEMSRAQERREEAGSSARRARRKWSAAA
ncbi:hypothetical protein ACFPA8_07160 [Streptomyces ovatisporus]|uniref:Uncharacterized protein n=1 Tax=Streptomyces ovatisporus TaxID=1128682 RepID=A0ABV9A204_9ACTN